MKSAFAQNQRGQRVLPFMQFSRILVQWKGYSPYKVSWNHEECFLPQYVEFCQEDYLKSISTLYLFSKTVFAVIIFKLLEGLATK